MKMFAQKKRRVLPHPNPLPPGEGTAVGYFVFCESFSSRWPTPFCQVTGSVPPSPSGSGPR